MSEYFRDLLLEDQKRHAQERVERLLLEGLDSGKPIEVTPEFWRGLRREVRERVKKARDEKKTPRPS